MNESMRGLHVDKSSTMVPVVLSAGGVPWEREASMCGG